MGDFVPTSQNANLQKCRRPTPKDQASAPLASARSAISIANNEIKSFQFSILNFQISKVTYHEIR